MRAEVVATPVLERAAHGEAAGVVRGATERAAYLDIEGFVVALTAPGVPLMPNGIAVGHTAVADGAVRMRADGIALADGAHLSFAGATEWEPALRPVAPEDGPELRARAAAVLAALGDPPPVEWGARGSDGVDDLNRAVGARDPAAAGRAADALLGLGSGLTPEGDDLLTATAAVVVAAGAAAGFAARERERWLAALVPRDAPARTTALSATLLALAREGRVVEPLHRLLDPAATEPEWVDALTTLAATGASTGRAYATAAATALALLLGDA